LTEEFRKFSGQQVGLPEAGRRGVISEEGRQVQDQLDALNRREVVLETKLRNRSNVIAELMSLQGQEFADATAQYNKSFSQAIQLYNLFDSEQDELQRNAKANLDVIANAYQAQIEAGQLTIDQITGIQRAKLEEYEIQAGLPVGSTLAVLNTLKPGETKLYSGVDNQGTFTYITQGADGTLNVEKIEGAAPPKSTLEELKKSIDQKLISENAFGEDKKVSWETYLGMLQVWLNSKKSRQSFDVNFPIGQFLDENNQREFNEALKGGTGGGGASDGGGIDNPFD